MKTCKDSLDLPLVQRKRRPGVVIVLACVLATTAGCGNSSDKRATDDSASESNSSKIQLPEKYANKDTLVLAVGAAAPPQSFVPAGSSTPQGFDVDLGVAITKVLGKEAKLQPTPFDSILPALASGRADIGLSGFTDTRERQQVVDFVNYLNVGSSIIATPEVAPEIDELADLCGTTVAVTRASAQGQDVSEQSIQCEEDGKAAIEVNTYPAQNDANLAVASGRADASVTDTPVAVYAASASEGRLVLAGEPYGAVLEGIAVPKDSGLAIPVQNALDELIADGTYSEILKKWNVEEIAVKESSINAGDL